MNSKPLPSIKEDGMYPTRITVHCTDTGNNEEHPAHEIRRYHVEEKQWSDIGYHYVIQPSGEVEDGRPLDQIGAHVGGFNKVGKGINVGICLVGRDRFSRAAFSSLDKLCRELMVRYDLNYWDIYCHYEYSSSKGKTCPNIRAADLIAWMLGQEMAIHKYSL